MADYWADAWAEQQKRNCGFYDRPYQVHPFPSYTYEDKDTINDDPVDDDAVPAWVFD